MRFFTTVATFGLAAFALAQDSTSTEASEVSSATESSASSSATLTKEQKCVADCGATDICCQAACVGVPCPNDLAANQTTACAGDCTQGNGTEEETAAYASCQASCISASFFPVSTGAGSGSGSNTASGSDSTATGADATGVGSSDASSTGSGSESGSASQTGASASSTNSDSGASIRTAVSGAGLFGLVIAGLAL